MSDTAHMAYDQEIAGRLRALLSGEKGITERAMFGGLAFLVDGNMAVTVSGQGGLLVRVNPEDVEALLREDSVEPAVMRGREMRGWLRVAPESLHTPGHLEHWAGRALSYARSLPAKG